MSESDTIQKRKRVIVGITGGIAAYKSPALVRRLIERGAEVRVVMTVSACEFITPLTMQAVSGHPVHQELLDVDAESGMGHIELARWAQLIVIAPTTANTLTKIATGMADDLLTTIILASKAELVLAPAMNPQMWSNSVTQENLEKLKARNIGIIGPGSGDHACGETGVGRMTEPEEIARLLLGDGLPQRLAGSQVLITAGPTWEAIDPVRGITNHSSGKMGYALAEAANDMGADVTLVSGPVALQCASSIFRIDIQSAQQMYHQVMQHIHLADIFIGVAAVADYKPAKPVDYKIKKTAQTMSIKLTPNPDILFDVGHMSNRPYTVGFAAETENILKNARTKLKKKKVDLIVANNVTGKMGAFDHDENEIILVFPNGETRLPRDDKYSIAQKILNAVSDNKKTIHTT